MLKIIIPFCALFMQHCRISFDVNIWNLCYIITMMIYENNVIPMLLENSKIHNCEVSSFACWVTCTILCGS